MSGEGITPSLRPAPLRTDTQTMAFTDWCPRAPIHAQSYVQSYTYVHQASCGCILFLDASIYMYSRNHSLSSASFCLRSSSDSMESKMAAPTRR